METLSVDNSSGKIYTSYMSCFNLRLEQTPYLKCCVEAREQVSLPLLKGGSQFRARQPDCVSCVPLLPSCCTSGAGDPHCPLLLGSCYEQDKSTNAYFGGVCLTLASREGRRSRAKEPSLWLLSPLASATACVADR